MINTVRMRRGSIGYVRSHQFRKHAYWGSAGITFVRRIIREFGKEYE